MAENSYGKRLMRKEDYLKAPDFLRTGTSKQAQYPSKTATAKNNPNSAVKSTHKPYQQSNEQYAVKKKGLFDMLNLNNIEMDSDRSMLLMLLALLSGKDNETDELMLLALMYIML